MKASAATADTGRPLEIYYLMCQQKTLIPMILIRLSPVVKRLAYSRVKPQKTYILVEIMILKEQFSHQYRFGEVIKGDRRLDLILKHLCNRDITPPGELFGYKNRSAVIVKGTYNTDSRAEKLLAVYFSGQFFPGFPKKLYRFLGGLVIAIQPFNRVENLSSYITEPHSDNFTVEITAD